MSGGTASARPLGGGRLTAGIVRIGETVRRPVSSASAFTATVLSHLARAGFDGAPRYLGRDDLGRDVLTFLPGDVPAKWRAFTDEQVMQAGMLLRRLHDASRGLAERVGGGPVVCHHDPGPNNTVFRGGRPVAFIDFDFAAIGDPLEDLGYMAWSWCISSKATRGDVAGQARQVRLLADAYGLSADQRGRLPAAVVERLARNERFWQERVVRDSAGPTGPTATEVLAWTRQEKAFVMRNRGLFAASLA
ncbi:phosphotransferase [Dactylosporangium sp. NPDC051485]|uniref:phosphotransferase family protein n=1 Tax=Dactylosporangium sp. NPDC051485 TaxID=3154846 RepID=UPI00342FCA83